MVKTEFHGKATWATENHSLIDDLKTLSQIPQKSAHHISPLHQSKERHRVKFQKRETTKPSKPNPGKSSTPCRSTSSPTKKTRKLSWTCYPPKQRAKASTASRAPTQSAPIGAVATKRRWRSVAVCPRNRPWGRTSRRMAAVRTTGWRATSRTISSMKSIRYGDRAR